jgi:cytochrome c oxidase cbb3-type subunit 3
MPAFKEFLGDAKVHLLAAYVYGLGGGQEVPPPAAAPAPAAEAPASPAGMSGPIGMEASPAAAAAK